MAVHPSTPKVCTECHRNECEKEKKKLEEENKKLQQARADHLSSPWGPSDDLIKSGGYCDSIGLGPGSSAGAMNKYVTDLGGNANSVTSGGMKKYWADGSAGSRTVPWCNRENAYKSQSEALKKKMDEHNKKCPDQKMRQKEMNDASAPAPTPDDYAARQLEKGRNFFSGIGGFIPGVSQILSGKQILDP